MCTRGLGQETYFKNFKNDNCHKWPNAKKTKVYEKWFMIFPLNMNVWRLISKKKKFKPGYTVDCQIPITRKTRVPENPVHSKTRSPKKKKRVEYLYLSNCLSLQYSTQIKTEFPKNPCTRKTQLPETPQKNPETEKTWIPVSQISRLTSNIFWSYLGKLRNVKTFLDSFICFKTIPNFLFWELN